MNLDKRSTSVIGFAVIIGLLIAGWFLILNPSITKQGELNEELKTTQSNIEKSKVKIAELEKIKADIDTYKKQDSDLSKRFPDSANIKLLLDDINEAGKKAGVNITELETGTPVIQADPAPNGEAGGETAAPAPADPNAQGGEGEQTGKLATMSLNITAVGNESKLIELSTELTQMNRAFLIQESSIDCKETSDCTLSISGTTYLYRPSVVPGEEPPAEEAATPESPAAPAPATTPEG